MNSSIIKFFTVSTKASISTFQYPILTKKDLLDYFYEEVKFQNHATLKRKEDIISFSVTAFTSKYFRNRNKFNSYSEAEFKISEQNKMLTVSFIGICKNLIYVSFVLPIFIFIFLVCSVIASNSPVLFLLVSIIAPIIFLVIIALLLLFMETISMQLYLTNKINRIKENLSDNQSLY